MAIDLLKAFNFTGQGLISLIGGGGKTSLMFKLAMELADSGSTVLTTSTTKIFYPAKDQSPATIITPSLDDLIMQSASLLKKHPHICAGFTNDSATGKVIGFTASFIDKLWETKTFDWIIVEADGAKRKPIKASDVHEPVVPHSCTHLVIVAGLDAIGTPLDDKHVHRPWIFSQNTDLPMGAQLTEKSISQALAMEMEKAKKSCPNASGSVFLNKADTSERIRSGEKIAAALQQHPAIDQVITASLHKNKGNI
ncbi:MAG: putative selenium-dependent hydroxylase accessory protein YqeC [Desulfobacula sp.]|nr:putative selenium-dependent hydroxylase accessory protein YqeC [Desulfobacula sp.]